MVVEYYCLYFFLNEDLVGFRFMINFIMMLNCSNFIDSNFLICVN